MYRIIKIGMDVHSNISHFARWSRYSALRTAFVGEIQVSPDYKEVINFIKALKLKIGLDDNLLIENDSKPYNNPRMYFL